MLERDGTFVQTVAIKGQPPATVKGSWSFDSVNSKVTLRGMMPFVDAFGHLERDWRAVDDFKDQPVELLWFRTEIETNESYGYVKKWLRQKANPFFCFGREKSPHTLKIHPIR